VKPGQRVVIVGGGPVGAVLALSLHRQGIPATILEKAPAPIEDQRAASIQPSAVEMLDALGVAAEAMERGMLAPVFHYRDRVTGDLVAEFDYKHLADVTRFPFVVQYEQFKLVDTIFRTIGPSIGPSPDCRWRFSCEVTDVTPEADRVRVAFRNEAGEDETLTTPWLIGCDGASSVVRRAADIEFVGFTYPERFVKIGTTFDFYQTGFGYCTRNFLSDPDEWCNLFKVKGYGPPGIWRTVFPTRIGETDEECLGHAGIQRRMQRFFPKAGDYDIAYAGLYLVHQRVVETFRKGRILLAGDAAHVNNPIGGLGMNSGIHDAFSLGDKLGRVIRGEADDDVLDLYSRQRRKAQIDGVQATSIANKQLMEAKDPAVRRRQLDDIRRTAEDPARAHAHMRRTALFESLAAADQVT
jgi:3-(3-hydroxy-phenyl)propionate hydroxylase